MGTAIMYESLVQQFKSRLDRVQAEAVQYEAPRSVRIFRMPWIRARQAPDPLAPTSGCSVCETGMAAAEYVLEGLLEGLVGEGTDIPNLYQSADGLCLAHLRSALVLAQTHSGRNRVREILLDHVQKRMDALQKHLSEYIRKHGWDSRAERITPEEYASWSKAIAFFSGGLRDDIPRETSEGE